MCICVLSFCSTIQNQAAWWSWRTTMRMSFQAHHLNLRSQMLPKTACPCPGSPAWPERRPSPLLSSKLSGNITTLTSYWFCCVTGCRCITWNHPFLLHYSQSVSNSWQTVADHIKNTQFTVRGLRPNTIYLFMVRAVNSQGLSDPSPMSDPVRTQGTLSNMQAFYIIVISLISIF